MGSWCATVGRVTRVLAWNMPSRVRRNPDAPHAYPLPTIGCVDGTRFAAPPVGGQNAPVAEEEPTQTASPDGIAPVPADQADQAQVEQPAKLLRIAMMVRELLEEVRRAPIDDRGRAQLRSIYGRVVEELKSGLSEPLADELERVTMPLTAETPTESEIRIAQAQLLGWLEGIFQGIQAAIATQQLAAAAQLEEMRRRRLPSATLPDATPGQYL